MGQEWEQYLKERVRDFLTVLCLLFIAGYCVLHNNWWAVVAWIVAAIFSLLESAHGWNAKNWEEACMGWEKVAQEKSEVVDLWRRRFYLVAFGGELPAKDENYEQIWDRYLREGKVQ